MEGAVKVAHSSLEIEGGPVHADEGVADKERPVMSIE